jgi:putative toxin-antitoxin system antitoxin component (TIGR02293 family)
MSANRYIPKAAQTRSGHRLSGASMVAYATWHLLWCHMAYRTVERKGAKADARHQPKTISAQSKPIASARGLSDAGRVPFAVVRGGKEKTEGIAMAQDAPTSAASLLGLPAAGSITMIKRVEAGLRFETLEHFQRKTQLSTNDLAAMVDIKVRTLRRRKDEGRLEPDESDRLLRASMIFAKALDLFEGDADAARQWFDTPAKALGGSRPIDFARTELGTREIEALINRIEHGVFS